MATMLSGSCRCGHVRFSVAGAPLFTSACHCRGCQRMTGGAFSLSAFFPAADFAVETGETVLGGLRGELAHHHCPRCFSWLWTVPPGMEAFRNVRTSMLDEPSLLPPFIETFTSEKLPFAESGAPRSFEGFPPEAEFPALLAAYSEWATSSAIR